MEPLKEISQFLDLKTRLDLKAVALQHVLSTTGSLEGREILLGIPEILRQLVLLAQDSVVAVAKDAALSLVNISADEPGASALLVISETSKPSVNEKPSDNLIDVSLRIIHLIEKSNYTWDALVAAFTAQKYNNKGANLHYLGPVFSNLSQSPSVRKYLMDKERCAIQRLLPFTEYAESIVRRGGIVGTLKNCCFDEEYHEWLLSDKIDILSHLLLPLAGPEEFDEEEQDKLPVDLQFLPENKERERDSDIRLMLLEALAQLCVTRRGREILRDKNAYVILREFHKWEKDKNVLLACENVVDILIRTEEEIGLDNLKEVEVPKKYHDHFQKMDQDFINDT
ncbi:protein HGH1 homolog isoform X2 [Cephus cinctus]|uniref:Protein HGH1 homolog n=1 Tax=Cephus cinctus TaxID=211228 RepID=A0AAJ7BSY1_CEPCN|nr:protein HGH1 homolog isoform X2 [Cephus cinctus]